MSPPLLSESLTPLGYPHALAAPPPSGMKSHIVGLTPPFQKKTELSTLLHPEIDLFKKEKHSCCVSPYRHRPVSGYISLLTFQGWALTGQKDMPSTCTALYLHPCKSFLSTVQPLQLHSSPMQRSQRGPDG